MASRCIFIVSCCGLCSDFVVSLRPCCLAVFPLIPRGDVLAGRHSPSAYSGPVGCRLWRRRIYSAKHQPPAFSVRELAPTCDVPVIAHTLCWEASDGSHKCVPRTSNEASVGKQMTCQRRSMNPAHVK